MVEWINCAIFITVEWYTALKMNQIKAYGAKAIQRKKQAYTKGYIQHGLFFSFCNIFLKASKTRGLEVKIVVSSVGEEAVLERERKETLKCQPPYTSWPWCLREYVLCVINSYVLCTFMYEYLVEKPGLLQSVGSQRVGDWATELMYVY